MAARYSDEEAKEIIERALAGDLLDSGGFDHEDLVAAAREVGIDPAALEKAANEITIDREAERVVATKRRKRKRKWVNGFVTFAIVNAFLFGIDYVTPGGPWFYWPLLGWGLFVALSGARAFLPPGADATREEIGRERAKLLRARAKEAERRRREAERAARKTAGSAFEETIERGVVAFLEAIATQVERASEKAEEEIRRGSSTGFESYVAGKRRGARGERAARAEAVPPAGPRARVEVDGDDSAPEHEEAETARRDQRSGRAR
jgi:hypothetical protein